jgi:DNA (cytosine-5)-methyltransferase 1
MTHLDLFSGIGGFAYAIDRVWDDVEHIFCDNEPFAQKVLKKHWKDSYIYDDIRSITDTTLFNGARGKPSRSRQKESKREAGDRISVDILTGGFPCQPFSQAGLRRGTTDDRYLWPEMLRVIRLAKPQWVVAENVRGLLTLQDGVVFQQVCADLEGEGYEVQPFIIPAVAVNAPHRRDRIWFVACNTQHDGLNAAKNAKGDTQRSDSNAKRPDELFQSEGADSLREAAADTRRTGGRTRGGQSPQRSTSIRGSSTEKNQRFERTSWNTDWMEVAAQFCSVDDGLPAELGDLTLTKAGHRAAQLKAYGNAIVPQVAVEIMKAIKYSTPQSQREAQE